MEPEGGGLRGARERQVNSFIHSMDTYGHLIYLKECVHGEKEFLPFRNSHDSEGLDNRLVNKWTNEMILDSENSKTKIKEDNVKGSVWG